MTLELGSLPDSAPAALTMAWTSDATARAPSIDRTPVTTIDPVPKMRATPPASDR
ncbi:MAG: hypothetical protein ABFC38_01490 [Methanospirillum sp.]